MTGMDGINSLQKALGALQVNDAANLGGTAQVAGQTARSASSAEASGADSARLSAAGGLASGASDVRMDKVASLQAAIAGGTYNVPSSAVADKLVESMLK